MSSLPMIWLPTVQLIGAQKAGTSAIADWLFEGGFTRPALFKGDPWYYSKEVHFFDLWHRYRNGPEFYAARFPQDNSSLSMDATPDTLQFANRVYDTYKSAGSDQLTRVKIIVILREPVSRELSLYNHLSFDCRNLDKSERNEWHDQVLAANDRILSFDEFVSERSIPALRSDTGPGQSTRHGFYAKHLKNWFELFDRNQILVLSYQELQRDPKKIEERIEQFLGLHIPGHIKWANSNESDQKLTQPSERARSALQSIFSFENEKLYSLLESNPGPPMEERPFPRFDVYGPQLSAGFQSLLDSI
ncbi:hypothetical protein ACHAXS_006214 [Conticribra weissflogii]